ncbi:hypothetical protein AQUCO_02800220v1 [Aquilegia coerulea]|uniref:WRC domain-containing protein n=1 Tax=Aquilegia coerulea TaxID=218851 RepID=A0A2G5D4C8_AQUCA|nr:hypothetical protein AQUCO_02800220v1 [Aquilegia coerulea]
MTMMMRKEEEEEETLPPPPSTPPTDLRCHRYDGKGWHCKGWRLQDQTFCQKHYFEKRNNDEKKKLKRINQVGKQKLKKKIDLDDGRVKRVKKNRVVKKICEQGSKREIVLAIGYVYKKERFDLDGRISNGVKGNGVIFKNGEESEKIEMISLKGCDNVKEKTELRCSRKSNVGGLKRKYGEEEEEDVEMIPVKKSDKKRGKKGLGDDGGGDSLVNDCSKKRKRGRPEKMEGISNGAKENGVESDKKWGKSDINGSDGDTNWKNGGISTNVGGEPLKEFEQTTKNTSRSSKLMRHWLLVKHDRELEMKTAAKCGTMSNVGRNENLTNVNKNTEEEKNEDATVVKDSSNAVNDFAGGSENLSRVSKDHLPTSNDKIPSADEKQNSEIAQS